MVLEWINCKGLYRTGAFLYFAYYLAHVYTLHMYVFYHMLLFKQLILFIGSFKHYRYIFKKRNHTDVFVSR